MCSLKLFGSNLSCCRISRISSRVIASSEPMESAVKKAKQEARQVKLLMLGKKSVVSRRGLDALLRTLKSEGLPPAFSRATQYRARKAMCNTMTPYGKLVQEVQLDVGNGRDTTVRVSAPLGGAVPRRENVARSQPPHRANNLPS